MFVAVISSFFCELKKNYYAHKVSSGICNMNDKRKHFCTLNVNTSGENHLI